MKPASRIFDRNLLSFLFVMFLLGSLMTIFGPGKSLDIKLYYTGEQARALLRELNSTERQKYFFNELCDLLFISSYTGALFLGLRRVYSGRLLVTMLALAPGFFDFVETTHILYALKWPGPHLFFDWLGIATFLKWSLGAVAFLVFLVEAWRRQRSPTARS